MYLLLALFVLGITYRFTLLGNCLYWGDISLYFLPTEEILHRSLLAGRILLWNPYILYGQPFVGNPQESVVYPTTLLLAWLSPSRFIVWNIALHLFLAGAFTFAFLRGCRLSRLEALLGAMIYSGSGYLAARFQFPPMVQAAAFLPALLIGVRRIVQRPIITETVFLAGAVALSVMAAHPQVTAISFLLAFVYSVFEILRKKRLRHPVWPVIRTIGLALALGMLAAGAYLMPLLQLFAASTREHITWSQANRFTLLPSQLINFIFPFFFGNPVNGSYWGAGNFWEPCVYIGWIGLGLALWQAFHWRSAPEGRFWAAAAFIATWLAMGWWGELYALLYWLVPGMASFHDPVRFTLVTTFSLAVLSAIGLHHFRKRFSNRWLERALVAGAALELILFSSNLQPAVDVQALRFRPAALNRLTDLKGYRVYSCEHKTIWDRFINYSDYGPQTPAYVHALEDTLVPNLTMKYGLENASGYEPVPIWASTDIDGQIRQSLERQSVGLPLLLRLVNAAYLLLPDERRFAHPDLIPAGNDGVTVFRITKPLPKAFIVRRTRRVDGSLRSLSAMMSVRFNPGRVAIVSGAAGLAGSLPWTVFNPKRSKPTSATLVSRSATEETYRVNCGRHPGYLVWLNADYPGWTVRVDGKATQIERADHAFCGLALRSGDHTIEFRYSPISYRLGIYLSAVGLMVLSFLVGVSRGKIRS